MVKKSIVILITFSIAFFSCQKETKTNTPKELEQADSSAITQRLREVYYSLPSPMEIGSLFKQAKMKFNSSVLHDAGEYVNYYSEQSLAINMGIYIADLSIASLFNQQQYTLRYFETVKKLATELNIMGVVNDSVLHVLENNLDKPDVLQKTITEAIFKSDAYLEQANRDATASLIITASWVETMYLILSFVKSEDNYNDQIFKQIADQRLVLENLIDMLKAQNFSHKKQIISELEDLNKTFQTLVTTSTKQVYDPMADTVRTKTIVQYNIDKQKIDILLKKITKIRNRYISMN